MKKFSNSIPMSTQVLETFSSKDNDMRFTKVKIWLMHLGENLNGSSFDKEVVEKAIPSLANTPIMGSIGLNFLNEPDFLEHEVDLQVTADGELTYVNKTVPFGLIPETNNAKFEKRIGDDMVEREYLTVEGILWNKWEDAVELIYGKNGVTGQSMELDTNYKGYFDGEIFHFTDFKFYGACLLGDDVTPAMKSSTVEIKYSSKTKEFIDEKAKQLNSINFSSSKGGINLSKNYSQEDAETEVIVEDKASTSIEDENSITEETSQEEGTIIDTDKTKETVTENEEVEDKQDTEEKLDKAKEDNDSGKVEPEGVTIEVQSVEDAAGIHKKIAEEQENLPKPSEMITVSGIEYSAKDIEELLDYKAKYQELKQEIHNEKVESLFKKYSDTLSVEELNTLQKTAKDKSIEDLENQIFALIGKKQVTQQNSFSVMSINKEGLSTSKIGLVEEDKNLSTFDAILKELK